VHEAFGLVKGCWEKLMWVLPVTLTFPAFPSVRIGCHGAGRGLVNVHVYLCERSFFKVKHIQQGFSLNHQQQGKRLPLVNSFRLPFVQAQEFFT
jgi:hypothetical protein